MRSITGDGAAHPADAQAGPQHLAERSDRHDRRPPAQPGQVGRWTAGEHQLGQRRVLDDDCLVLVEHAASVRSRAGDVTMPVGFWAPAWM